MSTEQNKKREPTALLRDALIVAGVDPGRYRRRADGGR